MTQGYFDQEKPMPNQSRAIAFDVDAVSLASLRAALPTWQIDRVNGATSSSLARDWDAGAADLLVVALRENVLETLAMCRFLACSSFSKDSRLPAAAWGLRDRLARGDPPLLVLLPAAEKTLVGAALEAGAHSCLLLPIDAKEVASMLLHARAGNQPGRHTASLEGAQTEDRWRDDGGQG